MSPNSRYKFPPKWHLTRSESGPELPIFSVQFKWMQNPRNGLVLKRLVLETSDWVNIVAVTPEKKFVMIRQYRFGIGKITTEIPGGIVDPQETSKESAIRELIEETGYTSENWSYLGAVEANPATQNNLCHHWLAQDVQKTNETNFGRGEDIVVLIMSLEEVLDEIRSQRLRHSLALSALSRVINFWERIEDHHFSNEIDQN